MFNLLDLSILDLDLKYLYYLRIDPHELQNTFGKEERRVRLSSYTFCLTLHWRRLDRSISTVIMIIFIRIKGLLGAAFI
jgi:hypothetical protein